MTHQMDSGKKVRAPIRPTAVARGRACNVLRVWAAAHAHPCCGAYGAGAGGSILSAPCSILQRYALHAMHPLHPFPVIPHQWSRRRAAPRTQCRRSRRRGCAPAGAAWSGDKSRRRGLWGWDRREKVSTRRTAPPCLQAAGRSAAPSSGQVPGGVTSGPPSRRAAGSFRRSAAPSLQPGEGRGAGCVTLEDREQ